MFQNNQKEIIYHNQINKLKIILLNNRIFKFLKMKRIIKKVIKKILIFIKIQTIDPIKNYIRIYRILIKIKITKN